MDVATLILLVVLFVGILVWAFRPKHRRRFEKDADIPFHDDDRRRDSGRRDEQPRDETDRRD